MMEETIQLLIILGTGLALFILIRIISRKNKKLHVRFICNLLRVIIVIGCLIGALNVYTDLEKAYETRSVVFKFDDKYYRFEYDHSYDWDDEDVLEEELEEVIPVEETIIVYKRKE